VSESQQSGGRTLFCRVITPESMVFDGEVERVIVRIADGDLGVLPDHYPVVSTAEIGAVRVKQGDENRVFAISDGFFKVSENLALVLVEEAVEAGEIDVSAAENRIEEIERERAEGTPEEGDPERFQRDLDRRVKVAENLTRVAREYGQG
jgi:F-type H+-transporting ATPase subunit epsilon